MVAIELVSRASTSDVGTSAHGLLVLWLFFQIFAGHIFLPILVGIFVLSKKAKRHPTLVNLCITWIISGISSCLLLYSGTHEGQDPSLGLCLTQSSLLYGVPPMTSMAVFAVVFQIWLGVFNGSTSKNEQSAQKWTAFRTTILLAAPYVVFGAWSTASAWLGVMNPSGISRNRRFFYCSLDHTLLTDGIGLFTALILVATMVFEVWIGVILRKNWRAIRSAGRRGGVALDMMLRVVIFGTYVFAGMVLSLLSIAAPKSPVPDLWVASVGPVVVLLFGSQRDVFKVVMFWRKPDDDEATKIGSQSDGPVTGDKLEP